MSLPKSHAAIQAYLQAIAKRYDSGLATEHTYRGDLQQMLEALAPGLLVTNEPPRIECGAPDYILTKNEVPVGYIEAKDVPVDLNSRAHDAQMNRYRRSLPNLILTNYIKFRRYRDGEVVADVDLATLSNSRVKATGTGVRELALMLEDFCKPAAKTIRSARQLAEIMAAKSRLMAEIIQNALDQEKEGQTSSKPRSELYGQMEAFRKILIHDITEKEFSDIYAQTIAYGMFAARLHDPTLEDFSRAEAARLIPVSNPFLRKLFSYVAGSELDERVTWIVNDLAEAFRLTDIKELVEDLGKFTSSSDPIIHFYETFLAEYDPELRKSRGVWYTPEPVVQFIVKAVDQLLKSEFGLPQGLADTAKTKVMLDTGKVDKRAKKGVRLVEHDVHRVQLLDPAAGTGTFLAEVVRVIATRMSNQRGTWSNYVEEHLVPRINGFEILMASYAMAHLKLGLLLEQTGYVRSHSAKNQRLNVYLTNSLEEFHPDADTLFAQWLSQEANAASAIKRDCPVMVVLGNPPYRGLSENKGEWIMKLIEDYKFVDGVHFGEKKHWLGDDYVKFIRFGQHFVEKTGEGILAYICNHSFLDNTTFRGMRWHLAQNFDEIFIVDLHGNRKRYEVCPDGSKDENIFDIEQGVTIFIAVRKPRKGRRSLGRVRHAELWGTRDLKYETLASLDLNGLSFVDIDLRPPEYFFVPKNRSGQRTYDQGFSLNDLFRENSVGFVSARDAINIHFTKEELKVAMETLVREDEARIREIFQLKSEDPRDWTVPTAKRDAQLNYRPENLIRCAYRLFDDRWTCYSGTSRGLYASPQSRMMRNFLTSQPNFALVTVRKQPDRRPVGYYFVADKPVSNGFIRSDSVSIDNLFPLYLVEEPTLEHPRGQLIPNFVEETVKKVESVTGLTFGNDFAPETLFDYVYAVLYSPSFRAKYEVFLKTQFPKIPYPDDAKMFLNMSAIGEELRKIHLFKDGKIDGNSISYPEPGTNEVGKAEFEKDSDLTGKIWINDQQYFGHVSTTAWLSSIGGYEPAQKWLKDRKGRTLNHDDVSHYRKILESLSRTVDLQQRIDRVRSF